MNLYDKIFNSSNIKVKINDTNATNIDVADKSIKITEDNIYNISSVGNAINTISSLVATLPIELYKNSGGKNIKVLDDHRLKIVNKEPNFLQNGTELKKLWIKDFILDGNFYGIIRRDGNAIESIDYITPKDINFDLKYADNGAIEDIIVTVTKDSKTFKPSIFDIIYSTQNSIDGLKGKGILQTNQLALETALNEMVKYKNSLSDDYSLKGILAFDQMKKEAFDNLKQALKLQHSGIAGSSLVVTHGADAKFIPSNLSPSELEVIKARKLSHDLGKEILGDVQGDLQDLHNKVLVYYLEVLESAYDKALLLEEEKEQNYFFKFDTSQLLRGDLKGLMQTIKIGIDSGVLSINQAKEMLDLEPIAKDYYRHSLGNVLIDEQGNIQVFNTGEKSHV